MTGRRLKLRSFLWRLEFVVVDHLDSPGGDNTPEQIAFKLLERVAEAEGVSFARGGKDKPATRKWILDTYAECLDAVRANRRYNKPVT